MKAFYASGITPTNAHSGFLSSNKKMAPLRGPFCESGDKGILVAAVEVGLDTTDVNRVFSEDAEIRDL